MLAPFCETGFQARSKADIQERMHYDAALHE